LNADLNRLVQWSKQNNLVLNSNKSKFLILGARSQINGIVTRDPTILIDGDRLEHVTRARNLGLLMDERLLFEDHIGEVMRNCFYRLKVLYNIRECLDVDTRIKLCETLVLSKLNYADTVYGACLLVRTKKTIQRIQNACARFCFSVPRRSHISPFLNQNKLLNMSARRDLHFASLLFGVIKKHEPLYLYDKLKFTQRKTRIASRLLCPTHRTAAFRGSFRYAATKCWNNLPPPIKNAVSVKSCKQKFKRHLIILQSNSN
jgi:hypothetical protein